MKLLQVTNFLSHHQLPTARAFAHILGPDSFRFAVMESIAPDRKAMGWDGHSDESWILNAGESQENFSLFEHWFREADVVLCGNRTLDLFESRISTKKLTFYMSERWWKPPVGLARLLYPPFAQMAFRFRRLSKSPYFHYLPMGGYADADMRKIARFGDRAWEWGYYTSPKFTEPITPTVARGKTALWAGRMLGWKRVDTLIRAFGAALEQHPEATLTLVGDGPERARLLKLAAKLLPAESYRFLSSMPATAIPGLMASHRLYILPSNAYEGWGAVINEAMAAECVVIASLGAGATASMIGDERNGLVFLPGDWKGLAAHIVRAFFDDELCSSLALRAKSDIETVWSPEEAAARFIAVSGAILQQRRPPVFELGPLRPQTAGVR